MKRALIDLSSVLWTCLLAGQDKEFGTKVTTDAGKEVIVNSAGYGYENALNHLIAVMEDLAIVPRQMIFVVEGKDSKAHRRFIYPQYKAGRDKLPGQYEAFNEAKRMVLDTFLALGAQAVSQDGIESDDVICYLGKHLQGEVWNVSADKDLAQCVGGNVHHWRMGARDKNPFMDFPFDLIPVYQALVGDGDEYPGAKGFGPKAFEKLLLTFGEDGLRSLKDLIVTKQLLRLQEDVPELKELQKIIDNAEMVYTSYNLAVLKPHMVNTLRRPLQWQVGMVKLKEQIEDQRLRRYGGEVRLVSQENYQEALEYFRKHVTQTPELALDIETSTPPESDAWIESLNKEESRTPVDVFGSELTGMGLTFGRNMHLSFYLTVDHVPEPGVTNLSVDQVQALLREFPTSKPMLVHNAAFELPIIRMEFDASRPDDPLWRGFLPNVIDTRIMSSYVDENRSAHLKSLSKEVLGYDQQSYQQTVTAEFTRSDWMQQPTSRFGARGREVSDWWVNEAGEQVTPEVDEETGAKLVEGLTPWVRVERKMNELTARHVLGYGSDDTICTAALGNHFRAVMEIEGTWNVFMEVEQFPAYLTAKAFLRGVDFSREEMARMEKDDDVAYEKAWATLRQYLIDIGFDGVNPPVFDEITPAAVKEAHQIVLGTELKTLVRMPDKLAKLIEQSVEGQPDEFHAQKATLLASVIRANDVAAFNKLITDHFTGEPQLDLASPKQMKRLLYDIMKLPVHIVNDVTDIEKKKEPEFAAALYKFKAMRRGKDVDLTDEDLAFIRRKAKADDISIQFALAFDTDKIDDHSRAALKAIGIMKKVMTRRSLFYKNYWTAPHWKDGRIHASVNQCAAVTRRYSSSGPNLQQLPKKGEAVRFREFFKPHHRDAVVCSIDYTGQELRLAADRSQDRNMLACYIGEHLKDLHSMTAAGAMRLKWGKGKVDDLMSWHGEPGMSNYDLFIRLRALGKAEPIGKLADDLRKDSKNVNFTAQFGGQDLKISERLIMPIEDARIFLEARSAMFPDVDAAAKRAEEIAFSTGHAKTYMGGIRHLAAGVTSDDRFESSRAARQAWNMEIQGSAAEMTKLGMGRLWLTPRYHELDVVFWAPIHDELVSSVHRDHAVEYLRLKHAAMTAPYSTMAVPILGSVSVGPDFGHQIECSQDDHGVELPYFDPERVERAVNAIFEKREAA